MAAPVVLILGPPAAGKGTQSQLLADHLGGAHVSSGQALRDSHDPVIAARLASGELARTEDFLRVVEEAITRVPATTAIVLDGVGRMLPEAEWLTKTLERLDRRLQRVIYLTIDDDEARRRAVARGRPDDDPTAQPLRWKRFQEETVPVVEFYRRRGVLTEVDGSGSVEDVAARIRGAVSASRK